MTTEQWQKVKEVYDEVAACEAAEWPGQLSALIADSEVRAEVEQLLGLQVKAIEFLERPPLFDVALPSGQDQTGKQIGAYRLLRQIGRGGMGTVYLAERADDVHRKQVAVKLVWPGFDSAEIFKRFRQERHILAELDHPNIARLLDGGTTDEGWSYVVMEYVDGEPLTRYCNQHKLSVAERLKLFQQVCAAVSYAHRNLVVHRDLKPSNILVTKDGTAKLLDFGIAKILDPALRPDSLSLTNTGMQAMTPEYASPEQVRGETITTATDVYSLGVLLYELLTGHQPYHFPKRALHEVMRVIAEQEPLRPSQGCSPAFRRNASTAT
ncbi:MAG: serine/threonine-protein kinase, partial [Acidobacteriota bacterium]